MFDGVHLGHRYLFDQLFAACREHHLEPAAVTFDSHPLETINPSVAPPLLTSPEEKTALLEEAGFKSQNIFLLRFDQKVRAMSARDFMAVMHNRFDVDLIVRGFNNRFGTERNLSSDDYRTIGKEQQIEVIDARGYCHNLDGRELTPSSSEIRRCLERGDISSANKLLGHPYQLSGTVGSGKQIGRTIGFPTANLVINFPQKLIPPDGVYIARGRVLPQLSAAEHSQSYPVMLNIGTRPTVDGNNNFRTIEAHFIGLDANLYNREIKLDLHHFLRPEISFPTIDLLRQQLDADRAASLKFFEEA